MLMDISIACDILFQVNYRTRLNLQKNSMNIGCSWRLNTKRFNNISKIVAHCTCPEIPQMPLPSE